MVQEEYRRWENVKVGTGQSNVDLIMSGLELSERRDTKLTDQCVPEQVGLGKSCYLRNIAAS